MTRANVEAATPMARSHLLRTAHVLIGDRRTHGGADHSRPAGAEVPPVPMSEVPLLADPLLVLLAGTVDDLERTRIAMDNRVRQLTRNTADADGVERGFGLDETAPTVATLAALTVTLKCAEDDAVKLLRRALRAHPLGGWVRETVGVGEKQGARLLAAIGDPYWNILHDRPRTVSELWAYCGHHVLRADQCTVHTHEMNVSADPCFPVGQARGVAHNPRADGDHSSGGDTRQGTCDARDTGPGVAARPRKGQRSNWSATAKMRAHLIAQSCIKQAHSPYRATYDARRAHTAVTHPDWTPGHSHNDALRITAKEILKGLWVAARDIHAAYGGDR